MREETLLAFDYGTKKLGVAMGNTLLRQARPLEIITAVTRVGRFGRIAELLAEWEPDRLVVGLALNTDGSDQYATLKCRRFANQLHGRFNLPVVLVDERGTSIQAQHIVGHAPDDAVAASLILQRYFDAQSSTVA